MPALTEDASQIAAALKKVGKTTTTTAAAPATDPALSVVGGAYGVGATVTEPADTSGPGSWSSAVPYDQWLVADWFSNQNVPGGGDLANQLARQFFDDNGRWPTPAELLNDRSTMNTVTWAQSGFFALPPTFGVKLANGQVVYYANSPKDGLRMISELSPGLNRPGGTQLQKAPPSGTRIFTEDVFNAILGSARGSAPRGSGPGRGSSGPAAQVFDRDQLIESVKGMWQGYLIEDPADPAAIADAFIDKSNAFLAQGGRLDFETFVTGKIRETARYKMLYQRKPEGVPEQQWLGQYVQAVAAAGLSPGKQLPAAARGAAAGVSADSFQNTLSNRPDVRAANQGSFSQKFAAHFSQLGLRGT